MHQDSADAVSLRRLALMEEEAEPFSRNPCQFFGSGFYLLTNYHFPAFLAILSQLVLFFKWISTPDSNFFNERWINTYNGALSAVIVMLGGCIVLFVSSTNRAKRFHAAMVTCHAGASALGLLLCSIGATYVDHGPTGKRLPYGLFALSSLQPLMLLQMCRSMMRAGMYPHAAGMVSWEFGVGSALMYARCAVEMGTLAVRSRGDSMPLLYLLWPAELVLALIYTYYCRNLIFVVQVLFSPSPWYAKAAPALVIVASVLSILGNALGALGYVSEERGEFMMAASIALRSECITTGARVCRGVQQGCVHQSTLAWLGLR